MDDISELDGIATYFTTCVFISCWTESIEENIALWKMYTPNMKGVRISLPIDMFRKKLVKAFAEANYGTNQSYYGPLSKEETFTDNYIVINVFDNPTSFYKKVKYRNNHKVENIQLFEQDEKGIHIKNVFDLGSHKHSRWSFQQESRFTLYATPLLPFSHPLVNGSKFNQMQLVSEALNSGIGNSNLFIDVDLDHSVLDNIGVTLGPLCTTSDDIIASALLKEYTKNGTLEWSELHGTIR